MRFPSTGVPLADFILFFSIVVIITVFVGILYLLIKYRHIDRTCNICHKKKVGILAYEFGLKHCEPCDIIMRSI